MYIELEYDLKDGTQGKIAIQPQNVNIVELTDEGIKFFHNNTDGVAAVTSIRQDDVDGVRDLYDSYMKSLTRIMETFQIESMFSTLYFKGLIDDQHTVAVAPMNINTFCVEGNCLVISFIQTHGGNEIRKYEMESAELAEAMYTKLASDSAQILNAMAGQF